MTHDANISNFVYVTFIRTTPDRLWSALTEPDFIKQYWFNLNVETTWKIGAPWELRFEDGRIADAGEIVEFEPTKRLVIKWRNEWKPEFKEMGYTQCTMELKPQKDGVVKLSITHTADRMAAQFIEAVSGGWPRILSNLKSLLETGEVILKA